MLQAPQQEERGGDLIEIPHKREAVRNLKENTPTGPGERRERKEGGMEPAGVLSCQDLLDLAFWSPFVRALRNPVGLAA
jgi:hypothetical protein